MSKGTKGIIGLFYIFFNYSCSTWTDKDLYIPEIFINERNETFLIIKNNGHSKIDEKNIYLELYYDGIRIQTVNLDTIDPHFRNSEDSSILKLPEIDTQKSHSIFVKIDIHNVVTETDEDHNSYSRSFGKNITWATPLPSPVYGHLYSKEVYSSLIETAPFASQVQWPIKNKNTILSYWPNDYKKKLLAQVEKYYKTERLFPIDTFMNGFDADIAFGIFITYIAHALILEHEKLVPWSVQDFKPQDLNYLWNGNNFFYYDSLHNKYEYSYEKGGGIKISNPLSSYYFVKSLAGQSRNPENTITAVLNWMKAELSHAQAENTLNYQFPEDIYYPKKGNTHSIHSCWASAGLLVDIGRSLNLPIAKSQIALHNGLHAQIDLLVSDEHITHADDIYDPLFYSLDPLSNNLLPFKISDSDYQNFIKIKPYCKNDTCHTTGQQNSSERRRYLVQKALDTKSKNLWLRQKEGHLKAYLRADDFPTLLSPPFNEQEQKEIDLRLYQAFNQKERTKLVYERYVACKNNIR